MNGKNRLKNYINTRTFRVVLTLSISLLLVATLALSSFAQDRATTLLIDGLNLPCVDCTRVDENNCSVKFPKKKESIMPCSEALLQILVHIKTRAEGYAEVLIEPLSLAAYLLKERRDPLVAQTALEIITSHSDGSEILNRNLESLAATYPSELAKALSNLAEESIVCSSFWSAFNSGTLHSLIPLVKTIIRRCPGSTSQGLPRALSQMNIENNLALISEVADSSAFLGDSLRHDLSQLNPYLKSCKNAEIPDNPPCPPLPVSLFIPELANYVTTVQLESLVIRLRKLPPPQALKYLSETNYQHKRTPEVHRILAEVLRQLQLSPNPLTDLVPAVEAPGVKHMLRYFASQDTVIAKLLANQDAKLSKIYFEAGNINRCRDLLLRSLDYYDDFLPERGDAMQKIHDLTTDISFREEMKGLIARHKKLPFSPANIALLAVLTLTIVLGFADAKLSYQRRLKFVISPDDALTIKERQELREGLQFFELSPMCSMTDLTEAYHRKAKELHPDLNDGEGVEDFQRLQPVYERTRVLLERRHPQQARNKLLKKESSKTGKKR